MLSAAYFDKNSVFVICASKVGLVKLNNTPFFTLISAFLFSASVSRPLQLFLDLFYL